jgi:hypothetical protein
MNLAMTVEADREAVIEIQEPLPLAPGQVMDLGAHVFAITDFTPEVGPQVSQSQLGVPHQLGAADLADTTNT